MVASDFTAVSNRIYSSLLPPSLHSTSARYSEASIFSFLSYSLFHFSFKNHCQYAIYLPYMSNSVSSFVTRTSVHRLHDSSEHLFTAYFIYHLILSIRLKSHFQSLSPTSIHFLIIHITFHKLKQIHIFLLDASFATIMTLGCLLLHCLVNMPPLIYLSFALCYVYSHIFFITYLLSSLYFSYIYFHPFHRLVFLIFFVYTFLSPLKSSHHRRISNDFSFLH